MFYFWESLKHCIYFLFWIFLIIIYKLCIYTKYLNIRRYQKCTNASYTIECFNETIQKIIIIKSLSMLSLLCVCAYVVSLLGRNVWCRFIKNFSYSKEKWKTFHFKRRKTIQLILRSWNGLLQLSTKFNKLHPKI